MAAALVCFVALVGASVSCSAPDVPVSTEAIRLGTVLLEPSLPVFVAEDQGLFAANDLDVTITYYDVGLHAADGVVSGEVDLSTPVAEYVVVGKVFASQEIVAIASVDKVDYAFVIGRKDHGINEISDLKGKSIGVVPGTILDFQLGRFLMLNGMSIGDVTLIGGTLPQTAESLLKGEIDAAMTIPPFIGTIRTGLADNAVLWSAQSDQPFFGLVVGRAEWIDQHPEATDRFLRAMGQAEEYIAGHPEAAKALLKAKMSFTDAEVERAWAQNDYSLSLDQSLILAMEDEARWMIENGLTEVTDVPNFLDSVYVEGLERVRPGAVSVIR